MSSSETAPSRPISSKFGEHLSNGLQRYVEQIQGWIAPMLVAALLCYLPLFFVLGPISAGLANCGICCARREPVTMSNFWHPWNGDAVLLPALSDRWDSTRATSECSSRFPLSSPSLLACTKNGFPLLAPTCLRSPTRRARRRTRGPRACAVETREPHALRQETKAAPIRSELLPLAAAKLIQQVNQLACQPQSVRHRSCGRWCRSF